MCAICQYPAIGGFRYAIFIAQCTHAFHFQCITACDERHGNRICPVCRFKWKQIPFQIKAPGPRENQRGNTEPWYRNYLQPAEPGIYDDDDPIEPPNSVSSSDSISDQRIEIRTCPEITDISKSDTSNDFTVLIHLKASVDGSQISRAPVDLVTVLDVSGSMTGTKLALLKRAMGFVIHHLAPYDRLSVIAYSSRTFRLFPLRRMDDTARQQALQADNSLSSNGGTNIAEGFRKGVKIILDRKSKNPVSSIILLSDGEDTCTVTGPSDYISLLPCSIQQIPEHTFGFGADHDALSMHSIAEGTGGTFSFIEVEAMIQNVFAQCMGGLLSVVAQEVKVDIRSMYSSLEVESGSYPVLLADNSTRGVINVRDLYAEEERDFLVTMKNILMSSDNNKTLLKINSSYHNPLKNAMVTSDEVDVKIDRPDATTLPLVGSIEVDRQRNRLRAEEAMLRAQSAAEHGNLDDAASTLGRCREMMSATTSTQAGDPLSVGLVTELREMQERMSSRQVYEAGGRAFVLSGLSSHSLQRATVRGDTTTSSSLSQVYQTTMMTNMVYLSLSEQT